jgi:MoxR-like ATPase
MMKLQFWKKQELDIYAESERMFAGIYAYDNLKEIMYSIATGSKINSMLLAGDPGTGKTQIADCIKDYFGDKAYKCLGNSTKKAGIYDYLFQHGKDLSVLILDELDKMSPEDQGAFLGLMQKGEFSETKYGKTRSIKLNVRVIATANNTKKILEPLLTRFAPNVFYLKAYGEDEYIHIGTRILTQEEGAHEDVAEIISRRVWAMNTKKRENIRAVVKVFRYTGNDITKLDPYLAAIKEYSK